jgi:glycosyltransferase involved in cell wall biosynthesis
VNERLSVVLPVYNERPGIELLLADANRLIERALPGAEIVVVDDASTDGTAEALERSQRDNPNLRVIRQSPNRGHGPAVSRTPRAQPAASATSRNRFAP